MREINQPDLFNSARVVLVAPTLSAIQTALVMFAKGDPQEFIIVPELAASTTPPRESWDKRRILAELDARRNDREIIISSLSSILTTAEEEPHESPESARSSQEAKQAAALHRVTEALNQNIDKLKAAVDAYQPFGDDGPVEESGVEDEGSFEVVANDIPAVADDGQVKDIVGVIACVRRVRERLSQVAVSHPPAEGHQELLPGPEFALVGSGLWAQHALSAVLPGVGGEEPPHEYTLAQGGRHVREIASGGIINCFFDPVSRDFFTQDGQPGVASSSTPPGEGHLPNFYEERPGDSKSQPWGVITSLGDYQRAQLIPPESFILEITAVEKKMAGLVSALGRYKPRVLVLSAVRGLGSRLAWRSEHWGNTATSGRSSAGGDANGPGGIDVSQASMSAWEIDKNGIATFTISPHLGGDPLQLRGPRYAAETLYAAMESTEIALDLLREGLCRGLVPAHGSAEETHHAAQPGRRQTRSGGQHAFTADVKFIERVTDLIDMMQAQQPKGEFPDAQMIHFIVLMLEQVPLQLLGLHPVTMETGKARVGLPDRGEQESLGRLLNWVEVEPEFQAAANEIGRQRSGGLPSGGLPCVSQVLVRLFSWTWAQRSSAKPDGLDSARLSETIHAVEVGLQSGQEQETKLWASVLGILVRLFEYELACGSMTNSDIGEDHLHHVISLSRSWRAHAFRFGYPQSYADWAHTTILDLLVRNGRPEYLSHRLAGIPQIERPPNCPAQNDPALLPVKTELHVKYFHIQAVTDCMNRLLKDNHAPGLGGITFHNAFQQLHKQGVTPHPHGGAVRDCFLGIEAKDVDVGYAVESGTGKVANQVVSAAKALQFPVKDHSRDSHELIRIGELEADNPFDLIEGMAHHDFIAGNAGVHGEFTVNGLAYDTTTGLVIDTTGTGVQDLCAGPRPRIRPPETVNDKELFDEWAAGENGKYRKLARFFKLRAQGMDADPTLIRAVVAMANVKYQERRPAKDVKNFFCVAMMDAGRSCDQAKCGTEPYFQKLTKYRRWFRALRQDAEAHHETSLFALLREVGKFKCEAGFGGMLRKEVGTIPEGVCVAEPKHWMNQMLYPSNGRQPAGGHNDWIFTQQHHGQQFRTANAPGQWTTAIPADLRRDDETRLDAIINPTFINGQPRYIVYHGTSASNLKYMLPTEGAIDFQLSHLNQLSFGFYVTASPNEAKNYACQNKGSADRAAILAVEILNAPDLVGYTAEGLATWRMRSKYDSNSADLKSFDSRKASFVRLRNKHNQFALKLGQKTNDVRHPRAQIRVLSAVILGYRFTMPPKSNEDGAGRGRSTPLVTFCDKFPDDFGERISWNQLNLPNGGPNRDGPAEYVPDCNAVADAPNGFAGAIRGLEVFGSHFPEDRAKVMGAEGHEGAHETRNEHADTQEAAVAGNIGGAAADDDELARK